MISYIPHPTAFANRPPFLREGALVVEDSNKRRPPANYRSGKRDPQHVGTITSR